MLIRVENTLKHGAGMYTSSQVLNMLDDSDTADDLFRWLYDITDDSEQV